jgi:hypothetical protein
VPGGTLTRKQARGVTAQLRGAVDVLVGEGAVRLLPATAADDGVLRRCADTANCFDDVARARGADRLARGVVEPVEGGLRLVLAVTPGSTAWSTTLDGTPGDAQRLDRLAREAFAEDTLRGALTVVGQPGDVVAVDGRRRGALPSTGRLLVERLREGRHILRVTRPETKNGTAYDPFERDVAIRHREEALVKVVLLPRESTAALGGEGDPAATNGSGPPTAAVVSLAAGGALLVGGAVCGVLSLLDSLAVEERAAAQQLVFPRDEVLVTRGTTLAVVADLLFGTGALAAGGGMALWMLTAAPAEGAP